jgi:hypothetical protein
VSRASRLLILAALLSACAPRDGGQAAPNPARYLYVWAGTAHHHDAGTNFIAVVDVDTSSATYGKILTATPADSGMMPHHAEYTLPAGHPFFANDFMTGRTVLVDASTPLAPRVVAAADSVPHFRQTHSFMRVGDTLVIATLQFGDSTLPGNPGGLAEFTAAGRLLRTASSADSAFPGARIRTYGLALVPAIDRALSTSSPMDTEKTANVIQLWRLSDLTLLRTTAMPGIAGDSVEYYPFEARTLADGRTVFLNTYTCGFYRITDLDRSEPKVELVYSMREPRRFGCSVPIVAGRFWVMPVAYSHVIVTLDLADPSHPVEVSRLPTDTTFFPHWLAADPGSDRLVVTEQGDGLPRIMMLRLDRRNGRLSWDERFKEADSTAHGLSFARAGWPNGITGPAMPHAALFVP